MSTPQSPRHNQEQTELTKLCGCQAWNQVIEWLGGMDIDEIMAEVNLCWPEEENNDKFAQRLFDELKNE